MNYDIHNCIIYNFTFNWCYIAVQHDYAKILVSTICGIEQNLRKKNRSEICEIWRLKQSIFTYDLRCRWPGLGVRERVQSDIYTYIHLVEKGRDRKKCSKIWIKIYTKFV